MKVGKHFWSIFITLNLCIINNLIKYVLEKTWRIWLRCFNSIWNALASKIAHQPPRSNWENISSKVLDRGISRENTGIWVFLQIIYCSFPKSTSIKQERDYGLLLSDVLQNLRAELRVFLRPVVLYCFTVYSTSDKILQPCTWTFCRI